MGIIIRQVQLKDFQQIQNTHIQCFPNSFSTSLGKQCDLLTKYYKEFYYDSPELFLIAQDDLDEIVGFCMGYYCENKGKAAARFVKNNRIRIFLYTVKLLMSIDKAAWSKVRTSFCKKNNDGFVNYEEIKDTTAGDLLSICVKEKYRGNGTANMLIDSFEDVLRQNGRRYCLLSVKKDNGRGIHFYEKNGYTPYKSEKQDEIVYVKEL